MTQPLYLMTEAEVTKQFQTTIVPMLTSLWTCYVIIK